MNSLPRLPHPRGDFNDPHAMLGSALQSFMDIDGEILSQAFLAESRRKRKLTGQ